MANVPGNPPTPAGPVEAEARMAVAPEPEMMGAAREVYIVTSRYGPEGIYSTPDRARAKINLLMTLAAYRDANSGLMTRPYILDSE
jgi:hypothetical protein